MTNIFGCRTMDVTEAINCLIEEAKVRIVWWGLCIFAVSLFLTHTSKSMWMNVPVSVLLFSALHILFDNVEFHWKVQRPRSQTYLSHVEKKQLSLNDARLSTKPLPPEWKSEIGSPVVEAALNDFVDKLVHDFIIDLVCKDITPDKEFPDQIHVLIMDALGDISRRVKEINLVDLLTRDIVHLVGDHIDLFRKNQAAIGVDVMLTLSSEERDERLKYHLLNSMELHPAVISPESEYKVLRQLMSGVLALVLRRQEAHCPVIRSIAQEILTCLVMQPVLKLACPGYINELIEELLHIIKDMDMAGLGSDQCTTSATHHCGSSIADEFGHNNHTNSNKHSCVNQGTDETFQCNTFQQEPSQARHAEWARMLEAATQRRTEVLMPENLDNMWTKGRDYKKKETSFQDSPKKGSATDSSLPDGNLTKETAASKRGEYAVPEGKSFPQRMESWGSDPLLNIRSTNGAETSQDPDEESSSEGEHRVDEIKDTKVFAANKSKSRRKRPDSASLLGILSSKEEGPIISEFQSHDFERQNEGFRGKSASDMVIRKEGQLVPHLRCRVMGAYFEKLDSKTFAVYSIAVTDAENNTWFVKRRYRNFDTLHWNLKDIPKHRLQLPPKRIFSSSTEDSFVHERCILLDKYLQELLSIPNVTEHLEIWDFLSISSKNYTLGKSSTMRTLAVNIDCAGDDIVWFKGVSDGLTGNIDVPLSSPCCGGSSTSTDNSFWNADEVNKIKPRQNTGETVLSPDHEDFKDSGKCDRENIDRELEHANGWHSNLELNSNGSPPHHAEESGNRDLDGKHDLVSETRVGKEAEATNFTLIPDNLGEVPPEWTPPNVTVPILKLVDKVFQLKKRGWLRRQVFWISKQILQLAMEDAVDDFLLRQIHWLRREDTVAQGIRWVQDILWPGGKFFLSSQPQMEKGGCGIDQKPLQAIGDLVGGDISKPGLTSFEQQLEAARRASDIKKLLIDGAPTALVSLIGQKQYRRCARDVYYFSQSTICVKQLSFAILELVLISIFPEMKNLIMNLHAHMRVHQPV